MGFPSRRTEYEVAPADAVHVSRTTAADDAHKVLADALNAPGGVGGTSRPIRPVVSVNQTARSGAVTTPNGWLSAVGVANSANRPDMLIRPIRLDDRSAK